MGPAHAAPVPVFNSQGSLALPGLQVGLVEQRVASEIQGNLAAVRAHVQAVATGG